METREKKGLHKIHTGSEREGLPIHLKYKSNRSRKEDNQSLKLKAAHQIILQAVHSLIRDTGQLITYQRPVRLRFNPGTCFESYSLK